MAAYIAIGIVFILLISLIILFNDVTRLKNKVKQSRSSIDVYLNQRFDLIPNLAECARAYAEHEKATFENVARAIKEYNSSVEKDLGKAEKLYNATGMLFARAEAYPELKANELFLNLQKELTRVENNLQAARRLYNGDVTIYNTTIQVFPNNIIARMLGFEEEKLFNISSTPEKGENVKVEDIIEG